MRYPFAAKMIEQLAPALGIGVELEPEFGFAGELILQDGRRHVFRNTNFNLNPAGSHEIARDKAYTKFFLQKHGFGVPEGQTFFSPVLLNNLPIAKRRGMDQALTYANQLGYPVFIKPNQKSQGELVCKAYNDQDLLTFAKQIFAVDTVLLIEKTCVGRDYRVVVLDGQMISAYERRPLAITGDDNATIQELLSQQKFALPEQNRPNSEIALDDPRIAVKLRELNLKQTDVLPMGVQVNLLDNANLSTGGTSVDVTEQIHESFKLIAANAARTIGLRLAGVDMMTPDICTPANQQSWVIIELNGSPGLDNYASLGQVQLERVKDLYKKILLAL
jgi:D-alanine-D-alanine ligase-like ATP-grasp enzyme